MAPLLSIVVPFYRNQGMLSRQYAVWALEWPADLKSNVEVIIVDDGSPEPAANVARIFDQQLPALSIFRVPVDKPWNQHAARNIGAHEARGAWLLMTDLDHVIPADTLAASLDAMTWAGRPTAFTFARRDAPAGVSWDSSGWRTMAPTLNRLGQPKPHVNSFLIRKADYWAVGGYDEDYCGTYGTDSLFRRRLWQHCEGVELAEPLIRVAREVIADASTTTLPRKEGRSPGSKQAVERYKALQGRAGSIVTLSCPWERVL